MSEDKKTPLYQSHVNSKAKMVPFGGWCMPIQYEGIIAETEHCRTSVSIFDTCHMGEFRFKGDIVNSGIEAAISFPISKVPVGKCKYGFLMNSSGGVVDDLIVYRIAEDELMMVVNAATCDNDFKYMSSFLSGDYIFENNSDKTSKIDVQGPLSKEVMKLFFDGDFDSMKYFGFIYSKYQGQDILISRTGYTGELGYEIYSDVSLAESMWDKLLSDERVKPAGLGARDILRLEIGLSLYGQELNEKITPVEAGLPFFVDFEKEFVSSDILKEQKEKGTERVKIAFMAETRRSPRHDFEIYSGDELIGEVTSGVFSPMLKKGIGLGLVKAGYDKIGTDIQIISGRSKIDAKVCELPFYKNGTARKKIIGAG
ncbi:MAG: glycine cleavage system protein T [Denitrovibrio sp.]|nr:MAG: glycine cleavage system protein T [Denitrovibrio sp.]